MEKELTMSIQQIAENQLEVTKQVYLLSPSRMFAEFKGEKENVKNYNFLRTFDHVLNIKIKDGLIAHRIKAFKWLED